MKATAEKIAAESAAAEKASAEKAVAEVTVAMRCFSSHNPGRAFVADHFVQAQARLDIALADMRNTKPGSRVVVRVDDPCAWGSGSHTHSVGGLRPHAPKLAGVLYSFVQCCFVDTPSPDGTMEPIMWRSYCNKYLMI